MSQPSALDERASLAVELRSADVEEEIAADLRKGQDGRRENVDERESEFEVREGRLVADDRSKIDAPQRVQSAEVVKIRDIAARIADEKPRRKQTSRRQLQVLPRIDVVVMAQCSASLDVAGVRGADLVSSPRNGTKLFENRVVSAERRADERKRVVEADETDIAGGIEAQQRVIAFFESGAGVDPVIAVERI